MATSDSLQCCIANDTSLKEQLVPWYPFPTLHASPHSKRSICSHITSLLFHFERFFMFPIIYWNKYPTWWPLAAVNQPIQVVKCHKLVFMAKVGIELNLIDVQDIKCYDAIIPCSAWSTAVFWIDCYPKGKGFDKTASMELRQKIRNKTFASLFHSLSRTKRNVYCMYLESKVKSCVFLFQE